MILTLYFVQLVEILLSQRLGKQNRQMGLWPVTLKSCVGHFIKVWVGRMKRKRKWSVISVKAYTFTCSILIWFKYRVFLQFLSTACMFVIHQFLVSCHVQMFCNQRSWYFFLQCLRQNSFTCRLGKCGGLAFFARRIHKSHRNCCCCCCHFCDRSWWTRCSNSCLKKTWKFSLALSI